MATWASNGSQSNVNTILAAGTTVDGDIITIPAGTFTWGTSSLQTNVSKAVTIQGAGTGLTTINLASGLQFSNGVFQCSAACIIKDFKVTISTGGAAPFSMGATNGWRITNITYVSSSSSDAYFCYYGSYGLIDHCTIDGGTGSSELIFGRGPDDAWSNPADYGAINAVYVEDCNFNTNSGQGYVCDNNANGRLVVRFCTMGASGSQGNSTKVDAHGVASNGSLGNAASVKSTRMMEVYNNHWKSTTGFAQVVEMRGGTFMLFDNISDSGTSGWLELVEYGSEAQWDNFNKSTLWMTPTQYPVYEQVGVGPDQIKAATAITANQCVQILTVGTTNFTLIGAAQNTVGLIFAATGPGTGTGTVNYSVAGEEPAYLIHNLIGGSNWPITWIAVAGGATTAYGSAFTMGPTAPCMIHADTDIFTYVPSGFNGSTGVGRGTKAAMLAITGTKVGVGFWVTNEGSWNTTLPVNTSGQLYTWNGSAWVLYYTPYTYPYPTSGGGGSSVLIKRLGRYLRLFGPALVLALCIAISGRAIARQ